MSHVRFQKSDYKRDSSLLPCDTVMAGLVDKQPGISLAYFLAVALHVKHLSPLIVVLSLGPLGSMPLV